MFYKFVTICKITQKFQIKALNKKKALYIMCITAKQIYKTAFMILK